MQRSAPVVTQLRVAAGDLPAPGSEVLFGHQNHPRAQALILTLRSDKSAAAVAGGGITPGMPIDPDASANGSRGGRNASERGAVSIPAWPEYLHGATPSAANAQAVQPGHALAWLRALARGTRPVRYIEAFL